MWTIARAKLAMASVLLKAPIGRAAGLVFRDHVPNRGLRFDTSGFQSRTKAALAFGLYESTEIRFIKKYLVGAKVAVDLGASVGISGSHLMSLMREGGRLIAVEANPFLLEFLERSLRDHVRSCSYEIHHAALAYDDEVAQLQLARLSTGSRVIPRWVIPDGISIEVPTVRLGNLVRGTDEYVLVSDIEGGEAGYLFQEPEALDNCAAVVVELEDGIAGGVYCDRAAQLARFLELGFRLIDQRGKVVALSRAGVNSSL